MADLLPNPINRRVLSKATRAGHPTDPPTAGPAGDSPAPRPSQNRVGPNRVRKSLYLPADIAESLSTEANRIHHASQGKISKAEAAGEIIRAGLAHLDDVEHFLRHEHTTHV